MKGKRNMKKYINTLILSLFLCCILPTMPEYTVSGQSVQNTVSAPCTPEHSAPACPDINNPSDNDGQDLDSEIETYSLPDDKGGSAYY